MLGSGASRATQKAFSQHHSTSHAWCQAQKRSFVFTSSRSFSSNAPRCFENPRNPDHGRFSVLADIATPQDVRQQSVAPVMQPPTNPQDSTRSLLPLLTAQRPHYATIHIHARPYLLTEGDTVRLPFRMHGVLPGDILRLTRISTIGSRDYTLRGSPYIDEDVYECRAVVAGLESEPMRFKEKTMRRNRRVKTVRSKHRFTELTIKELKINQASP